MLVTAATLSAALLSFGLILLLQPLLQRYALARPNTRSSHRTPTPQGGGIAVISATVIVVAVAIWLSPIGADDLVRLGVVFAGVVALAIVGVTDDIRPLEALPRLILQGGVVLAVIVVLPAALRIIPTLPWWIERALLFVALLWFVNLVNFMDGIDWITVAEVVPVTAALSAFGFLGALSIEATITAVVLCGAMIGFAPFNRPVARLFLGDVGSLPIGLLLAWLLTLLAADHLAAAVLLPLYYAADATITLLRRIARGERVMEAHRSHFYQRALDGGMSVTRIVSHVFWLNIALAVLAMSTLLTPSPLMHGTIVAIGVALVAITLYRFTRPTR